MLASEQLQSSRESLPRGEVDPVGHFMGIRAFNVATCIGQYESTGHFTVQRPELSSFEVNPKGQGIHEPVY